MIKRNLYFGNPAYLSTQNEQLIVNTNIQNTHIPLEDIGLIILDNGQITISSQLLEQCAENNIALIHCNQKHLPTSLLLPLNGNVLQQKYYTVQINASLPLKKQLWQQTIIAKIENQAGVLEKISCNI